LAQVLTVARLFSESRRDADRRIGPRPAKTNIGKNQYRMNAQCLPAEGTDAALNLQDFGTSHWQLAD
jgi:hypothetical protein